MDEARLKSERSEALEVVEYDSSDHDSVNRYLFHDRLTPECSILSQIGWTMSNIHYHSIDDPFSDFATSSMPKSEANISGVDGLLKIADTRPSISAANMSCEASGLVETVPTSNPSASSSSSDQDLVEKSIGFGETAQPSLQIPSSKSKKKEQKRIRQPRIAFVTKSEVDHLEDGYRWRKYGQKAVKNSPYPRSYYRCTNMKCTVKKRVERSREDPTTVVTTYEGQHCHQTVAFPRGAGLSIRETVLGGKIGPPNSQFYYPGMQHLPRQSPHAGIASNTQPKSVPDQPREASRMITCNEPQLPAAPDCSAQLPSNEGLLEDIVSPRRRNLHP